MGDLITVRVDVYVGCTSAHDGQTPSAETARAAIFCISTPVATAARNARKGQAPGGPLHRLHILMASHHEMSRERRCAEGWRLSRLPRRTKQRPSFIFNETQCNPAAAAIDGAANCTFHLECITIFFFLVCDHQRDRGSLTNLCLQKRTQQKVDGALHETGFSSTLVNIGNTGRGGGWGGGHLLRDGWAAAMFNPWLIYPPNSKPEY